MLYCWEVAMKWRGEALPGEQERWNVVGMLRICQKAFKFDIMRGLNIMDGISGAI